MEEERELIRFIRCSLPKDTLIVAMCNDDFCRNFGNDYIPKSKVREKIEELEKIRKSMEEYLLVSTNSLNIQAVDEKIMILQELLED